MNWLTHPLLRLMQHFAFAALSFFILLSIFKIDKAASTVDYIYTGLFLSTLLPVVYFNLYCTLPGMSNSKRWYIYLLLLIGTIALFTWINIELFTNWSVVLFPNYFFIAYYTYGQIAIFFFVFVAISSLLKISKSWFAVKELQRKLLETEKHGVQVELKALKAQINPHFFFNTLNSVYSMSLDKDERLPGTILQLSELMRYFLYEAKEDFVSLKKEVTVLLDYIALQKIRSSEKLQVDVQISDSIKEQKIAPLLLITFLENAFKHGAKGVIDHSFIRLELKTNDNRIHFRLENNKGITDNIEGGAYKGLGLENVKRRLELLYPMRHKLEISEKENSFIVQLELQS